MHMGNGKTHDERRFTMRMPNDIWKFLKKAAVDQESSMTDIILRCVSKYRKKFDEKGCKDDTKVS